MQLERSTSENDSLKGKRFDKLKSITPNSITDAENKRYSSKNLERLNIIGTDFTV